MHSHPLGVMLYLCIESFEMSIRYYLSYLLLLEQDGDAMCFVGVVHCIRSSNTEWYYWLILLSSVASSNKTDIDEAIRNPREAVAGTCYYVI